MENDQKKAILGMGTGGGAPMYKLNRVQMSGDDGTFKLSDLLKDREKGTKPDIADMGKELDGVILKMRWALSKYDEPNSMFYSSTEYDDKWKDQVTIYPSKEKGSVENMKAKYALSTQRIVYMYVPSWKQIVRLIVKASALSGDKNPNGEKGLFEYIDEYMQTETYPCDYITSCVGVFRSGKNQDGTPNKRKDHYAMTFSQGRILTETEQAKVQQMMIEVNEKTGVPKVESDLDQTERTIGEAIAPEEDNSPNPDDIASSIPF